MIFGYRIFPNALVSSIFGHLIFHLRAIFS